MSADLTVPPPMPEPAGFVDDDGEFHGALGHDGRIYTTHQIDAINAIWSERVASLQARLEAATKALRLVEQWDAEGLALTDWHLSQVRAAIDAATQEKPAAPSAPESQA